jgi:hypothetical protein
MIGMRTIDSRPSSQPIRPKRRGSWASAAVSNDTPSSAGRGAGQVRMSRTQVTAMPGAPISGTIAIGPPSRGSTTNQGRVGLSQNCVSNPVA